MGAPFANPLARAIVSPSVVLPGSAHERKMVWAGAMTEVANECAAGMKTLPPAEQHNTQLRINALTTVANILTTTATTPPFRIDKKTG